MRKHCMEALKAKQAFIDTDNCNKHKNLFQGSDTTNDKKYLIIITSRSSIKINEAFQKIRA